LKVFFNLSVSFNKKERIDLHFNNKTKKKRKIDENGISLITNNETQIDTSENVIYLSCVCVSR